MIFSVLKSTFKQFHLNILKNLGFTRICREIVNVAIYALYPESFCGKNLAVRKVFAFSDSEEKREGVGAEQIIIWDANYCQENSTSLFLTYRLHYSNIAKIASLQIL